MSQLTDVAHVTITPQTVRSLEAPLSRTKRQALRTELVIAYIKSKPYGTRIKITDFMSVAQFKSSPGAHVFINKLVEAGTILRHEITPRTFFYTVPEDVKVTTPKARVIGMTAAVVEDKAKQFSWDHPDRYNDLHAFIDWLGQHAE